MKNQWKTSVKDVSIAHLEPTSDHRRLDLQFRLKFRTSKKPPDKSDQMRIQFFKDPELTEEFVTGMEEEEKPISNFETVSADEYGSK